MTAKSVGYSAVLEVQEEFHPSSFFFFLDKYLKQRRFKSISMKNEREQEQ